jgi:hypothetical protein
VCFYHTLVRFSNTARFILRALNGMQFYMMFSPTSGGNVDITTRKSKIYLIKRNCMKISLFRGMKSCSTEDKQNFQSNVFLSFKDK